MLAPDFGLTAYQRQRRADAHRRVAAHSEATGMHGFGDATAPAPTEKGGGDLFVLAAIALLSYRLGKSAGARVKQAPSAGAIFAGYFGLRAMDKLFGGLIK